jgi:hypothetical protein
MVQNKRRNIDAAAVKSLTLERQDFDGGSSRQNPGAVNGLAVAERQYSVDRRQ